MTNIEGPGRAPSPDHTQDTLSILGNLLAEPERTAPLVRETDKWMQTNADRTGDFPKAWMASRALTHAQSELNVAAEPVQPQEWNDEFFAQPVATRVSAALHHFCGYSAEEVAQLTNRPLDQVSLMLSAVRPPSRSVAVPDVAPPVEPQSGADTALPAGAVAAASFGSPGKPPSPPQAAPPTPTPTPSAGPAATVGTPDADRAQPTSGRFPTKALLIALGLLATLAAIIAAFLIFGQGDEDAGGADASRSDTTAATPSSTEPLVAALSSTCTNGNAGPGALGETIEIESGEEQRQFRLTITEPESPDPKGIVVWLPDTGEDPTTSIRTSGLEAIGQKLDLVTATAFPADGSGQWNVTGAAENPDDLGLIDNIVSYIADDYCVDRSRVVVAGLGTGAHLAASSACSQSGPPVALLAVGGAIVPAECESVPRSSLFVYGEDDEQFPMDGGTGSAEPDLAKDEVRWVGSRYETPPVEQAIDAWSGIQQCAGAVSDSQEGITVTTYRGCSYMGMLTLAVVQNAGHGWLDETDPIATGFLDNLRSA